MPDFVYVEFHICFPSFSASRVGGSSHEAHSVVPFRNFEEEMKQSGVWETGSVSSSTVDSTRDNLASLYRPPFALLFHGPFEKVELPYIYGKSSYSVFFTCS